MPEFDYIVVGAGTAGCVLAARLSQDERVRGLRREAGGADRTRAMTVPNAWPENLGTDADWGQVTTPQADAGPAPYPRGRALGGGSAINAMGHARGHQALYDGWAGGGAPGWGPTARSGSARPPSAIRWPRPWPRRWPPPAARSPTTSAAPRPRVWAGPTWPSPTASGSARPTPTCGRCWAARTWSSAPVAWSPVRTTK